MEKEPIWENPTLMECVGKGNFQLLDTGIVPSFIILLWEALKIFIGVLPFSL